MKVIFLIPPSPDKRDIIRMIDCAHETKANYLWQPNDYLIISSHLKAEDEAVFIDGTADKMDKSTFLEKVSAVKSGDILFFALSSVCWNSDYAYFQEIKKIYPDIPIFVIGDILLEKEYREPILKYCDGIIFHPYEIELDKMSNIKNENYERLKGICINPEDEVFSEKKVRNCNIETFPRHELFLSDNYKFPFAKYFKFATVTSVLNCPFSCSYCVSSNFSPVVRNYKFAIKELEYLESLGVKELFFNDKSFGFPSENATPLLEGMAKRFSFSWSCYFSPQLYDPKLLDLMKNAGCHTIIAGIDSANYESLHQYNRRVKQSSAENLVAHANRLNMNICADFIIGLEHETEEDILNTINYSLKLPLDYVSFNIASPLPGSSIRKKALEEGKIVIGKEGFDTLGNKSILGTKNVSPEMLKKLRKKAMYKFYLRPEYILRRLRKITSFEHFAIQFLEAVALFEKNILK